MYYSFTDVVGTGSGLSGGDLASKFRDLRNTLEKRGADFDSLNVRLTIFCSNIDVPQVKELSSRLEVDGKVHLDNGGPLGRGTRALCLVAAAGSEPGEDIEVEWSQLFEALSRVRSEETLLFVFDSDFFPLRCSVVDLALDEKSGKPDLKLATLPPDIWL